MVFADIEPILLACDDSSSRLLPNGNRFVRHLPDQGPLAFLHCLYAPAKREVQRRVQTGMGRDMPEDVNEFLQHANGAAMFDKTIHIYGYVDTFSRSTRLRDQTAISLLFENQTFATAAPDRWRSGWVKVGAVMGWRTLISLETHVAGQCALVPQEGNAVEYESFGGMMRSMVERVAPCFTCSGATDHTYAELEAALASLIRAH